MKFGDNSSNTTACLILFNMGHVCMHLSVQNVWGSLFFWTHCTIAVESGLTLAVDEVWWELEAGVAAAGVAAVAVDATLLTTSIPLGTLVHICSRARITETHTCTVLLHAVITSTMIDSSLAVRTDVEPGNSAQFIHVSDWAGAVLGRNIGGAGPSSSLPLLF